MPPKPQPYLLSSLPGSHASLPPSCRLPIFRAFFPKYRYPAQMKGLPRSKYRQTALAIHIPVPPNDISRPQKTVTKYRQTVLPPRPRPPARPESVLRREILNATRAGEPD